MAARFERLYEFPKNLYSAGSPIVVAAGALLKDTQTGNIIAQIKFQSVSTKRIKALKLSLDAFDISGNSLQKVEEYQYLDLNIGNGDFFGFNKAVVMPDNVTRVVKIAKITVVLEDVEYTLCGSDLQPMVNQERLSAKLSAGLVEQYQLAAGTSGEYIPVSVGDLWLCSCGTANSANTCAHCGARKDNVFNAYNPNTLNEHFQLRQEHQRQIEKQKQEQAEVARAKEQKKKSAFIKLGIIAALVLIAIVAINSLMDRMAYKRTLEEIDSYIVSGEYELAFDLIHTSDISYDDRSAYRRKVIPYMQEQHEAWRNSSKENLAFIVDGVEYYISEDTIYSKKDGKTTILYEAPGYETVLGISSYSYLRYRRSLYANGCLFFVECEEARNTKNYEKYYDYTAKYIDLETNEVTTLARGDSYGDIVKLDNGCIFIGFNVLSFNDGLYYNPYTGSEYRSEDAVSDAELEDKIYQN